MTDAPLLAIALLFLALFVILRGLAWLNKRHNQAKE